MYYKNSCSMSLSVLLAHIEGLGGMVCFFLAAFYMFRAVVGSIAMEVVSFLSHSLSIYDQEVFPTPRTQFLRPRLLVVNFLLKYSVVALIPTWYILWGQ